MLLDRRAVAKWLLDGIGTHPTSDTGRINLHRDFEPQASIAGAGLLGHIGKRILRQKSNERLTRGWIRPDTNGVLTTVEDTAECCQSRRNGRRQGIGGRQAGREGRRNRRRMRWRSCFGGRL